MESDDNMAAGRAGYPSPKEKNSSEEIADNLPVRASEQSRTHERAMAEANTDDRTESKSNDKSESKPEETTLNAEQYHIYQRRKKFIELLQTNPTEENLWQTIILFQNYPFYTASGLPFKYTLKIGRNGDLTKELWIDRRENSKSLAWSSVRLAFKNALKLDEAPKPKALGDIRGVSYIYPLFWKFGIIKVPEKIAEKMGGEK